MRVCVHVCEREREYMYVFVSKCVSERVSECVCERVCVCAYCVSVCESKYERDSTYVCV